LKFEINKLREQWLEELEKCLPCFPFVCIKRIHVIGLVSCQEILYRERCYRFMNLEFGKKWEKGNSTYTQQQLDEVRICESSHVLRSSFFFYLNPILYMSVAMVSVNSKQLLAASKLVFKEEEELSKTQFHVHRKNDWDDDDDDDDDDAGSVAPAA
ncbi:unnamed protein product, partial [Prunus brigantina]